MKNLIGKIVTIQYHKPSSSRLDLPNEGRLLKVHNLGDCVMIANPECQTVDDISYKGQGLDVFKWGKWVYLNEAEVKEKV